MSRSSYTASERRGVLAIGIIALIIIAAGIGYALYDSPAKEKKDVPVMIEHPEFIDSTRIEIEKQEVPKKRGKKSSKKREKKPIRKRSPLDEPV